MLFILQRSSKQKSYFPRGWWSAALLPATIESRRWTATSYTRWWWWDGCSLWCFAVLFCCYSKNFQTWKLHLSLNRYGTSSIHPWSNTSSNNLITFANLIPPSINFFLLSLFPISFFNQLYIIIESWSRCSCHRWLRVERFELWEVQTESE